jgi:glycosyltransferase involved in cell wall biosynthesis
MGTIDPPIRIMFVDEAATFGGTIVVLSTLINELDRSSYVPVVVSSMQTRVLEALFDSSEILIPLRCSFDYVMRARVVGYFRNINARLARLGAYVATVLGAPADILYRRRLRRIVQRHKPDLVHISSNSYRAVRVCAEMGKPFVWHLHAPSSIASTQMGTEPLSRANAAISISRYVAEHSRDLDVISAPHVVIPNPTPKIGKAPPDRLVALRTQLGIRPDQPVVGIFGRLVAWKGQKEFIEAFQVVLREFPEALALVVGDASDLGHGYEKDIRDIIEREDLGRNIKLYGYSDDPAPLYQLCSVVVHASIEPEPFGLVIIEAMSAGAAVIVSSLGAGPEIVSHEETGLIADPRNRDQLAAAVSTLLRNPDLRKTLAAQGQRVAETKYSPSLYARELESLYHSLLRDEAVPNTMTHGASDGTSELDAA